MFKKAKPMQAALKVSMYGPPGSGKTFTALLIAEGLAAKRGGRIAYVDTECGTDFYAMDVPSRNIHPAAFDFDALYTQSISDITNSVANIGKEYSVIVIDSISHLWDSAIEAYGGKRTRIDTIPMQAWGKIKKPYKDLIKKLMASPCDVFILGRQKNIFDNDASTGEMIKTGVAMRAEGETPYEPHICIRLESKVEQDTGSMAQHIAYVEKDRTGVLAGKMIVNPSFATILPLLPLLGREQAQPENEDERIAKDGELISKAGERDAEKENKSAGYFHEYQALFAAAANVAELGAAAAGVKKIRRYLLEEHENALREVYKSYRDRLVSRESPDL
jgi:hypothetical protein